MAGRLTESEMDQLESWIGTGPKMFTLLYSITRDGCHPTTFHQKCNFQGSTVTVLYNKHKSVFGGYTSQSWTDQRHEHVKDDQAFLFQLQLSCYPKTTKFTVKNADYAVLTNNSYGPLFGDNGDDLETFGSAVNAKKKGYYCLNGHMECFGNTYNSKGMKAVDINNNCMEVEELEVYKVTGTNPPLSLDLSASSITTCVIEGQRKALKKLWRDTKYFDEEFLAALTKEVKEIKPPSELSVPEYRLLMLGPVGSGKSSFYNTVNSVFKGRVSHTAVCGVNQHSTTTQYTPYTVRTRSGSTLKFRLCDTSGLEESQGIDAMECSFLLSGRVPDFYMFHPLIQLTADSAEFVTRSESNKKIHCALFAIEAKSTSQISDEIMGKLKRMKKIIGQEGIPLLVLLTKIDELSSNLRDNLSDVFGDETVKEKVDDVSKMFGVPPNHVLPVKNYVHECELNVSVSALALLALRQALYCAEDHLEYLSMNAQSGVIMATGNIKDETRGSDTA